MHTTYDVRIWKIEKRKGKEKTTYRVRWVVDGTLWQEPFETRALAESFRSDLLTAARKGEAFNIDTGLPVSMQRAEDAMSWYEFACAYVDMKWKPAAATYRRTIAEALTAVTPIMLKDGRGKPDGKAIRSALCGWAFNTQRRDEPDRPEKVTETLRWVERNSQPVSYATKPEVARALLNAAITRLDGKPAARTVARQRRMILVNAMSYAVERKLLVANPVTALKWNAPKPSRAIDRRRVVNPVQARTLLAAVREVRRSGPRLVACYAAMYFAALRPEEAVDLREGNLTLPEPTWDEERQQWDYDWGELYVEEATPHAGGAWTDSGRARDRRRLKHREEGEGRPVPCPPELTALLREHLHTYGTDDDGRLFRGERGGEVPLITWNRVWAAARRAAFTPEVVATPLARVPYDLRHAAVSTWLNGGVPAPRVAEWAGHSVQVLLEVYAKCLDGQDALARQQVQSALGYG